MSDKSRDPDFFCPQCGSSYFGTARTEGRCSRCKYTWARDSKLAERRAFPRTAPNGGCGFNHGTVPCAAPAVATIGWQLEPKDGIAWRACQAHAQRLADDSYWTVERKLPIYWDKDFTKKLAAAPALTFKQRAEAAGWKLVENEIRHVETDGSGGWCCDLPGHQPRSKGGSYGLHEGPEVWRSDDGYVVACTPCLRAQLDAKSKSPEPQKAAAPPPTPEFERCVACHAEAGFVLLRTVGGAGMADQKYCMDCDPADLPPTGVVTGERLVRARELGRVYKLTAEAERLGLRSPEILRPARGWERNYSL